MAGDQIATIGNRGNSTGPHLPLRGAAQRHRPHRPGAVAGQTGPQPRQLRRLSVSDRRTLSDEARIIRRHPPTARSGAADQHHPARARPARSAASPTNPYQPHRRRQPPGAADQLHPAGHARGDPRATPRRSPDRRRRATAVVSIVSGWATAVIATDLITGWWRTDRLFCVAVGFLTAVSAAATHRRADRAAAAPPHRPAADRRRPVVGADDLRGPVRRGRQAAAGGLRDPGAAAWPAIVLALLPATGRWCAR